MRQGPLSPLKQVALPPFPYSQCDVDAMHALDAVCSQGLVRAGVALLAMAQDAGVKMFTVADSHRTRALRAVREMLADTACPVVSIGFAELIMVDGQPYHALHIENETVCVYLTRCAFVGEDGHPVSFGSAKPSHMSSCVAAPNGMSFWPRELCHSPARRSPDTHTLIDKPKRRK